MDNSLNHASYSESLKNTLSCYQLSSADSLSGPSSYHALAAQLWFKENNQSPPTPRPPVIQIPLLIPNDTSTKRSETTLSGVKISCFIVGGEKRLCLPQILTTVLKDYSIQEINKTCAELHIYCSRCSPDQLEILKVLRILPFNTTQCGLITKTDAERLVAALDAEYHLNGKHDFSTENLKGIHVYHECFGRGEGIFYPDLYLSPDSTCIACLDCRSTFSPSRFVSHSHSILEKRTCHWGFDRENWRHYLLVPRIEDELKYLELEKQLDLVKSRFDPTPNFLSNQLKRRFKAENDAFELSNKRLKGEKDVDFAVPTTPANCFGVPLSLRSSAFKPWTSANLAGLVDLQATQDATSAFVKTFAPLMQDSRQLYPGLLHLAPSVVPPHTSSEWTKTTQNSQNPPNVSLQPMDLQKKSSPSTERARDSVRKRSAEEQQREGARVVGVLAKEGSIIKTEGSLPNGSYPVSCRRASKDASRVGGSDRDDPASPCGRPFIDPGRARSHLPPKKDVWKCASSNDLKQARNPDPSKRIQRGKEKNEGVEQRFKEEENRSLKSVVAAASAMLQLSRVEDRHKTSSDNSFPESYQSKHPTSDPNPSRSPDSVNPKVTPHPQSKEHFKWTFSDWSCVISASGTEELKTIQRLLNSIDVNKEIIVKELVKMKMEHEEKVEIQDRFRRDLQRELERVKSSKQRSLDEAADVNVQLRHELNRVRNAKHRETKESNEALISFGKKLADIGRHSSHDDRDSLQHKILDRLHKQIDEKEDEVRSLEKQLLEERDRRVQAERRLQEAVEEHRDRILLVDGCNNITSIVKTVPQKSPHNDSRSPSYGYSNHVVADLSASPSLHSCKDSGVHDV